jgi:proteic killer suppression protein
MTIHSFKDARSPELIAGKVPKGFPPDVVKTARRKLFMLDSAAAPTC